MNRLLSTAALLTLPLATLAIPEPAVAATFVVTNCNDSGPGSLRRAVANAASGSTIDARSVSCPTISLTRQIAVPQADLTILGSGSRRLTIDGNFVGRIFDHTGMGTLRLEHLWLVRGRDYVQNALGGCVHSRGNVHLRHVHMHACLAVGRTPPDYDGAGAGSFAAGGGILASGDVTLVFSYIHASYATTYSGRGGAIAANGNVLLYGSRISDNDAKDGGGISADDVHASYSLIDHNTATEFAGIHAQGDVYLLRTTIADNEALWGCGGLCVEGQATVVDSTLARNGAGVASAAGFTGAAAIHNSTIATNREGSEPGCGDAVHASGPLRLVSSIVASNYCRDGTRMRDITASSITGSRNIVRSANVALPGDTIRSNPRLQTLADNGGPTPTMALMRDSVAIDHGSNALGLSYDQRGPGYPRVKGAKTDIGAFER